MLNIVEKLGAYVTNVLRDTGAFGLLFIAIIKSLKRKLPPYREIIKQSYFIGVESLPVILTTGAFVGMVISFQSYGQLARLGVVSWIGPLVTASLVLQLGPVLSGLMLAGRVGSAMTAELGTMAVTEQIDALRTMGINPVNYLAFPRVLAATLLCPILTAFAILFGVIAGFGLCIYGLGVNGHFMWEQSKAYLDTMDFVEGLTKASIFGCAMAVICCEKGITTRGGAEGVGKATTASNVQSCIAILLLNLLVTMLFSQIHAWVK